MSYILYEGPSLIDGKPIVVLMVGIKRSRNKKTGAMAQTYILRSDISPVEAAKTLQDESVCGHCPHRQATGGSCYVNIAQGPNQVYKTYKQGKYKVEDPRVAGAGLRIRVGTYGDPGAVPDYIWKELITNAIMWTGYSHQVERSPELIGLCMASADTQEQAEKYQAEGWKTFRVKTVDEPLMHKEILCLNTTLGIQCEECGVCDGKTANVAINVHGLAHKIKNFEKWQTELEAA